MVSQAKQNLNKLLFVAILFSLTVVCNALACPDIEGVQIVYKVDSGSWKEASATLKPVANGADVKLRVVIETEGGDYYWGFSSGSVTGIGPVDEWDSDWGTPSKTWYKIMPKMDPGLSTDDNDPWNLTYDYYTNVVADYPGGGNVSCACTVSHLFDNPGEGTFLGHSFTGHPEPGDSEVCIATCTTAGCGGGSHNGSECTKYRGLQSRTNEGNCCAIIEYDHTSDGAGWEKTASTDNGVYRYTVKVVIDSSTYYALGREYTSTKSDLIYDTASDEQAYNRGAKDGVMRIPRRSTSSDVYLSYIKAYDEVPWIYGSWSWQARDYIGFDCADLMQAAAYHAAGDSGAYESSASILQGRTPIGGADEPYYLISGTLKKSDKTTNATFTIVDDGATATQINKGDLIMLDWSSDPDSIADHTTVLYCGSGTLDGTDTLVMAGHNSGVETTTLSSEIPVDAKIYLRRGW